MGPHCSARSDLDSDYRCNQYLDTSCMMVCVIFIMLHSASGVGIGVNASEITNLRSPEPGGATFSKNVKCQVNLTDGKYVSVLETCDEVRRIIQELHQC